MRSTIASRSIDPLPGIEDHLRHDDEIDGCADRIEHVAGVKPAAVARRDERELDAAAARVFAQDDVERVELAACRDHAGTLIGFIRIENRAQALSGARLRDHAIAARGVHETRESRAISVHLGHPCIPRAAHIGVPRGKAFAHVGLDRVERTAEGMIGEIDAFGAGRPRAGEKRRDMRCERGFGQRTVAERGDAPRSTSHWFPPACGDAGRGWPLTARR